MIYIKNNNEPSIEPWVIPALKLNESEACPFNKTLGFLFLRMSHKIFSKLAETPFCFNLKLCQELSQNHL